MHADATTTRENKSIDCCNEYLLREGLEKWFYFYILKLNDVYFCDTIFQLSTHCKIIPGKTSKKHRNTKNQKCSKQKNYFLWALNNIRVFRIFRLSFSYLSYL